MHPQSFYAVSKLAGMAFADAYRRFFGLRTTALRYFGVYGPRQDYRRTTPPVMSAFIIKLLRGERPVIYGTGEKRRDSSTSTTSTIFTSAASTTNAPKARPITSEPA